MLADVCCVEELDEDDDDEDVPEFAEELDVPPVNELSKELTAVDMVFLSIKGHPKDDSAMVNNGLISLAFAIGINCRVAAPLFLKPLPHNTP